MTNDVQSLYLTRQLSDGDKPAAPPAKAETLETWIVRAHCDKGSLQVQLPCAVHALPCLDLPCPATSCPALPGLALPCPTLVCPARPALSYPALPCLVLSCPVLPDPVLLNIHSCVWVGACVCVCTTTLPPE